MLTKKTWSALSESNLPAYVELLSEVVLGVLIGVFTTLVTLASFHHLVSPRISWSPLVRHIYLSKQRRPSYSVKMKVVGMSHLIETSLACRLSVRDVLKNGSRIWNFYDIPCSFSKSLLAKPGSRIIHLKLYEAEAKGLFQKPFFDRFLKVGRPDVGLRFEDFFMSYPEVYFQLTLIGHDRRTGVKRLYQSPRYSIHSIRSGVWNGMELEVDFSSKYS